MKNLYSGDIFIFFSTEIVKKFSLKNLNIYKNLLTILHFLDTSKMIYENRQNNFLNKQLLFVKNCEDYCNK